VDEEGSMTILATFIIVAFVFVVLHALGEWFKEWIYKSEMSQKDVDKLYGRHSK
jgi:hypothetical protein